MYLELRFRPKSAFLTPLTSSTIMGHLFWAVAHWQGAAALEQLLKEWESAPVFTLSNAFPTGLLPVPAYTAAEGALPADRKSRIEQLFLEKQRRKTPWCSLEAFCAGTVVPVPDDRTTAVAKEKSRLQLKNVIKRDWEAGVDDRTDVYVLEESWNTGSYSLYLHVLDEARFDEGVWAERFQYVFEVTGYGAKKSVGYGIFEIEQDNGGCFRRCPKLDALKGKDLLLLSEAFLRDDERTLLSRAAYTVQTKYGKIGENVAVNPFKSPVLLLQPGSVLPNETGKRYFGQMYSAVADSHSIHIRDCGYGLCLPYTLL